MAPTGHNATGHRPSRRTASDHLTNLPAPLHTCDNPPERVLLIASTGYGYVPPVIRDVQAIGDRTLPETTRDGDTITVRGPIDAACVLVVRAVGIGAEVSAPRMWSAAGGSVERVPNELDAVLAEVERADLVIVAVDDLDPIPLAAVVACEDSGVPMLLHYAGRYPYRPGTPQSLGKHPAQAAKRRRDARSKNAPRSESTGPTYSRPSKRAA